MLPEFAQGTVRERIMFVPDFLEKVDAVLAPEEGRADRVHGRVAPTLFTRQVTQFRDLLLSRRGTYLVVEAALMIEVVEERRVGLSAPQVHIGNLKVIED